MDETATRKETLGDRVQRLRNEAWRSSYKKELDRKAFYEPLEEFAKVLDYMCYSYTPSGLSLNGDGITRYIEWTCFWHFLTPLGKTPGQLRTHVSNLLGANIDPKRETGKEQFVSAIEIFLYHIIHCPKYTVIPEYHSYLRHKKTLRETETWLRETANVTGAASAVNAYFEGVPKEDILMGSFEGMSFLSTRFMFHRHHPDWEDEVSLRKFNAGINELRKQGKFWDGTNIDF